MHACPEKAILVIVLALVVLTSCQDQPQQAVAPEPAVVTVQIAAKQETASAKNQEAVVADKQKAVIAGKQETAIAKHQEAVKSTPKDAVSTEKPAVASPLSQPEAKSVVSEPAEPPFYSSKGKIDPFLPLIRTEKKVAAGTDAREKKPQRVLTPLEKFDLSQIRLVAVVIAESGNIAMVEETSGKGYVVRIGTYMGKNDGRVEMILRDRIVIKEIVKNFRGDAVPRSREMKLHKQEIEG